MARFKQVTEAFISRKLVEFWGNMVKNYTISIPFAHCVRNGMTV